MTTAATSARPRRAGALRRLETFPIPSVAEVELTSDELTSLCPVTGQPDLYIATIRYEPGDAASSRSR